MAFTSRTPKDGPSACVSRSIVVRTLRMLSSRAGLGWAKRWPLVRSVASAALFCCRTRRPSAETGLTRDAQHRLLVGCRQPPELALVHDEEGGVVQAAGNQRVVLQLAVEAEVDHRLQRVQRGIDDAALQQLLVGLGGRPRDRDGAQVLQQALLDRPPMRTFWPLRSSGVSITLLGWWNWPPPSIPVPSITTPLTGR